MTRGSGALHWAGVMLYCCLLSACEPSVGKVIERVKMTSSDGSTTITAIRYAEGTSGNPAEGEHLRVFCNSADMPATDKLRVEGKLIGQAYFVSKLGEIPKDRITVHSNNIVYGPLFSDFFFRTRSPGALRPRGDPPLHHQPHRRGQ